MRQGHEVVAVVAQRSQNSYCRELRCLAPAVRDLHPLSCLLDAARLQWALLRLRPDVVHAVAEPYGMALALVPYRPWKNFLTLHGTYTLAPLTRGGIVRWLFLRAVMRSRGVLAVSAFTRGALLGRAPELNGNAIGILPNCVDLQRSRFVAEPSNARKRIIGVGAVKKRKGYREAVEACAKLRDAGVDFQYDIFGSLREDPAYVDALRQRIDALGLGDIVVLRGQEEDAVLDASFAAADAFLLLSLQDGDNVEGFGIVFLEANAWGIPAVGPTTGGCPEAIADGTTGYVCEPTDAALVAKRLAAILRDGAIRREACRAWAEEHGADRRARQLLWAYGDGSVDA